MNNSNPSRFQVPPADATAGRMNALVGMPSGYVGAAALGSMSATLPSVAWRSRRIILVCVVLAVAAGFVYVQTATPIYTSTSQLYLDYVDITPLTPETGRPPQTERYLHTQAGLLRSRPIVANAVQTLEPQRLQTFEGVDVPVAFVDKNLRIDVGRKDDIISISFDSPYPVEAAQIVNAIVSAYMTSRSEHEQRNASQVHAILNKDLGDVRKELARKQTELEEFRKTQMPLSLGPEDGGGVMENYLGLQARLSAAEIAAIEARSFRDAVKALSLDAGALRQYLRLKQDTGSYVSEVQESPLEGRLTELGLETSGLSEKFTPEHPTIAALLNQRSVVEARSTELDSRFVNAAVAAAEKYCAEAADYEQQLRVLFDEQKAQIAALKAAFAGYQRLQSEVNYLDGRRLTLDQSVREIARIVNEDVGQLRMAILATAQTAENPSKPQKSRIMALALMLGLLIGGGIAVARDWFDQTLRSADEISGTFGISVLGVIPTMPRHAKTSSPGPGVLRKPDSHEAEAFRTVRTAIFFGAPRQRAKTLLVTSPSPGDGKSTLVSNLAVTMAVAGQKTIVLDADLRKPTQRLIFGVDAQGRSLEEVLRGTVKLNEAIGSTEVRGLDLLVCHGGSPNSAEILNSPRFGRLLEVLKKHYDRVLIDAPPVNVVTDAQILAAACDYTILVIKADKTTRKMAQRAIDALRSVGAQVLGTVVNQISKSGDRYGYYYGRYKRTYGSGSNGDKEKAGEAQASHKDRPRAVVRT